MRARPVRFAFFGGAFFALFALASCSSSESKSDTNGDTAQNSGDGGSSAASSDASVVSSDAGAGTDAGDLSDGATYRSSLHICWNDPSCPRALAISHGGDWNVSGPPYDSNAALSSAITNGSDGVKIDVRVTEDDVPVISHSSPIQSYESLDCQGKKIEEMTAAQVTACHRFPSSETFQRLDDVLDLLVSSSIRGEPALHWRSRSRASAASTKRSTSRLKAHHPVFRARRPLLQEQRPVHSTCSPPHLRRTTKQSR